MSPVNNLFMKKLTLMLISFVLLAISTLSAQSYIGYLSDNYSGIYGLISNPANIADSRFRADINLIGSSGFIGNDYFGIDINEVFKINYDFDEASKTLKDENNFSGNLDLLGPSFMFNLSDKSAIALFTRGRVFGGLLGVSGQLIENVEEDFDDNTDFFIENNDFNFSANAWSEFGLTYAQEIMTKGEHYLKGGLSLKYLQGYGNIYASFNNVSVNFDDDGVAPGNGTITSTGEIAYGNSDEEDFEEFNLVSGANGFGIDLGVVYEWRPDYNGDPSKERYLNKYKLKLGFSITDFGSIKYEDGVERAYDINRIISEAEFDTVDDFEDKLDAFYNEISSSSTTKAVLPTAAHLDADYKFKEHLYLNFSSTFSLISGTKVNASSVRSRLSLIPRYERKWFSFYSPISYYEFSGFQWNAGLRAGPLYFGSGSILSLLINDASRAMDAYAGLKIPAYHNKPRDKDGDGVMDKVDLCKNEAGPPENDGCPWPDSDGDTVLDKDDNCPNEKGEVGNKGCPWGDKDGDTLLDHEDDCPDEAGPVENNGCPEKDSDGDKVLDKDDKCPNEAGPVENKGCPEKDSDGDTVIDKNDKCPKIKGTVANNGCPEVSEEVQDTLNDYAKTILFNTGKSTIKFESYSVLTDIITILRKYPNAKFSIEGHTDSVGSRANNKNLSEQRANSVMIYLIKHGIEQSRLRAIGYGEEAPIGDNASKEGRAQNRRVEINLIK